ncbi:MAG: universal stress protein [Deltaproteobacteria bacterium]|nr:universal stress protein [Deltaproteobacteria bacterium]MBW2051056.1 universal stress protein [Deltaproteobacteria bacterium]MBW2141775.1 universal stress protein [Deltaproteobacteria bacterium]MBW2323195.1 universal stress protein [Deltaproteobacteria bacterium]
MSNFSKILFPVDLSEASPKIVPYVKEMMDKFGAEVHVIFVAHVSGYYASIDLPYAYMSDFESEIVKGADTKLADFIAANFKDYTCKARVASGYPAEEILKYVVAEGIDLVIMGTHGRKMIKRIVFGSVANHVVQKSPVPVLTINPYRMSAGNNEDDSPEVA